MGVVLDSAKEVEKFGAEVEKMLSRFGLEMHNAQRKIAKLDLRRAAKIASIESSLSSARSLIERAEKLNHGYTLMQQNPGKFSSASQAVMFERDMMDDLQSRRAALTERYDGNAELAERKLRHDVLKGFPDFFKNSKLSTRELMGMSRVLQKIPILGDAIHGAGAGTLSRAGAVTAGLELGWQGYKYLVEMGRQVLSENAKARRSGMSAVEYKAAEAPLKALGASAESSASISKNWNSNMGKLLTGTGGTEFLTGLAVHGIDISNGSGAFGLPTDKEIKARVSERIKQLYSSGNANDRQRALALGDQAGFDTAMFDLAIRKGKDINALLGYQTTTARKLAANEDAHFENVLAHDVMGQDFQGLKTDLLNKTFLRSFGKEKKNYSIPTDERDLPAADQVAKKIKVGRLDENDDPATWFRNAEEAVNSAKSLDRYEKKEMPPPEGSAPQASAGSTTTTTVNGNVIVQANSVEEFNDDLQRKSKLRGRTEVCEREDPKVY